MFRNCGRQNNNNVVASASKLKRKKRDEQLLKKMLLAERLFYVLYEIFIVHRKSDMNTYQFDNVRIFGIIFN